MKCKYLENQLYIGTNGQYRLCCVSSEPSNKENIRTHTPKEWKNSKIVKNAKLLLEKNEWPSACEKCKVKEEAGLISQRLKPKEFNSELIHLDLRFGNSCNLKCISCWSGSSSSIAQEEIDMSVAGIIPTTNITEANTNWASEETFKKLLDLPIQEVYLTGGEPMMVKNLDTFLERLDPSTNLRFNTNCTVWNPKIEKLLRKFNTVVMSLSLDAVDEKIEYIRYGSKWKDVEENAKRYADFCLVNISPTLSVLNSYFFEEIKEYADKRNWTVFENLLYTPSWLYCINAPDSLKEKFQIPKEWYEGKADQEQIEKFKHTITRLDKWRNINIKNYLPEVAKAYDLN